ncbi:hypothetical protein [Pilimelia columellifera]|uniref:MFS transporter n=1 Tax=Pilimelia columellifera subsp. columellifera TaxID=706583 RepID=A0ABP6AA15_9ACTN
MPLLRGIGYLISGLVYALGALTRAGVGAGRAAGALKRDAAGDARRLRLVNLHVAAVIGDVLVVVGSVRALIHPTLAVTDRARLVWLAAGAVAVLAVLAPVAGPVLDRWRSGRRLSLAGLLLARAALAWLAASGGASLPATAGALLALSALTVAVRAPDTERLAPGDAARFGMTVHITAVATAALVAPLAILAMWIEPGWPTRAAAVVFLAGAALAARLPARDPTTDAQPMPWRAGPFRRPGWPVTTAALLARGATAYLLVRFVDALLVGELATGAPNTALAATALLVTVGAVISATIVGRARPRRAALVATTALTLTAATAAVAASRPTIGAAVATLVAATVLGGLSWAAAEAAGATPDAPDAWRAERHGWGAVVAAAAIAAALVPTPWPTALAVVSGTLLLGATTAAVIRRRAIAGAAPGAGTAGTDTTRPEPGGPTLPAARSPRPDSAPAGPPVGGPAAPPGFHLYRPSKPTPSSDAPPENTP